MHRSISPFALGATLYMPVIHPYILDIIIHNKIPGLRSIVLCLEDALAEEDVDSGLSNLRRILNFLMEKDRNRAREPLVFIRPRNLVMGEIIATWANINQIDGFVAPKARPGHMAKWFRAVAGTSLYLMPTLETKEMLDPTAIRDFRDELLSFERNRILALRIGGNDLLSCLGLRRIRSMTLYDGPLGNVVSTLVGMLAPYGFALTSPVFEIIDDPKAMAEEIRRDIAFGLVGKTAIHPSQVSTINSGFSVSMMDVRAAGEILRNDAPAVFKMNGAMSEPSTHRAWAANIMERVKYFGIAEPDVQKIQKIEIRHPDLPQILVAVEPSQTPSPLPLAKLEKTAL
jgi:citrate lyase beta subunit